MATQILIEEFSFQSPINIDNGYTNNNISKQAKSTISVDIPEDGRGSFQWEVEELELYEEGGLWFEGNELTDYDGVFELPVQLLDFLESKGYNVDYARD